MHSPSGFAKAALVAAGLGAGTLLGAAPAAAVDLGPLRGSYGGLTPVMQWQGAYFGGLAGVTNLGSNAGGGITELVANYLRDTAVESEMRVSTYVQPDVRDRSTSYGVFAGYNFQFAEMVLGFEVDATLGRFAGSGSDSLGRSRTLTTGYIASAWSEGRVDLELENWMTLRARAGYTLGSFMPFVTGGLALAQYQLNNTATLVITEVDADPTSAPVLPAINPFGVPVTLTSRNSGVAYGFAGGAGVDVALTENVFLRGEWQYLHFPDLGGADVTMNSVRGAAGIKF